jgi:hypothetical protein
VPVRTLHCLNACRNKLPEPRRSTPAPLFPLPLLATRLPIFSTSCYFWNRPLPWPGKMGLAVVLGAPCLCFRFIENKVPP